MPTLFIYIKKKLLMEDHIKRVSPDNAISYACQRIFMSVY